MDTISDKVKALDEHVGILENTATQHSVHIEKSQNDIQSLFNRVKQLEDNQKPTPSGTFSVRRDDESNMEVDADKMIDERCVLIRNMAQRTRNIEGSQVNCIVLPWSEHIRYCHQIIQKK